MGASSWRYIEPWRGSVEATMTTLQQRVFVSFFSAWKESERPADIAELWSGDEDDEQSWAGFMGTQGTHTIVDIHTLVPAETRIDELPAWSTMRPVPVAEVVEAFGHDKPTRAEYEQLTGHRLHDDDGRWTGRCTILHTEDGCPEAVAFWGSSGD